MSLRDEDSLRIVKLGGSLLDRPSLRQHFEGWLAGEQPAVNLIIVGGGELVETMRRLDALHSLPATWLHEACIDLMQSTADMVRTILGCPWCQSPESLADAMQRMTVAGSSVFVAAPSAYRHRLDSLPRDWTVTSDSIAAHLARELNANELVLLKSREAPSDIPSAPETASGTTWRAWSEQGIVDPYFPTAASGLKRIRIVKL